MFSRQCQKVILSFDCEHDLWKIERTASEDIVVYGQTYTQAYDSC